MTQAIIVAAGRGSRLYPLTDYVPKVMIPVGKKERPMGHLIIDHCIEHGIKDFLFCLNTESGKQVRNYFGDGSRFGVNVDYSLSDEPQGTSGELKLAWERGKVQVPSLIYYGDTLCQTDLTATMSEESDITVVVNDLVTMPYGYIEDDSNVATRIVEKPTLQMMIPDKSVGAIMSIYYVQNKMVYEYFCNKGKDVSGDVLPMMVAGRYNVKVFHDNLPFVDVGNWKNYAEAMQWA